MPYHILDCETGYYGDYCQPCTKGKYGQNCQQFCSQHCKPSSEGCNKISGSCTCETGYRPFTCKYGELTKTNRKFTVEIDEAVKDILFVNNFHKVLLFG